MFPNFGTISFQAPYESIKPRPINMVQTVYTTYFLKPSQLHRNYTMTANWIEALGQTSGSNIALDQFLAPWSALVCFLNNNFGLAFKLDFLQVPRYRSFFGYMALGVEGILGLLLTGKICGRRKVWPVIAMQLQNAT